MSSMLGSISLLLLMLVTAGDPTPAAAAADREQAKAAFREGNGLFDQNKFLEAVAAYTRALELDPSYVEAVYNRAIANEMVDRQKAIEDFGRFLEMAGDSPDLKWDVARGQARLKILESLPPFPEPLLPNRYVPEGGDYYWQVDEASQGEQWRRLPVRVFLGNAPQLKWQQGAREAYNLWRAVFPMELVATSDRADISIGWEEPVAAGTGHAGETYEWVQFRRVGGELSGRRVAVIAVDLAYRWSKDEMRAIILHEMGHALGIKGHSESRKDIMFWQMQRRVRQINVPVIPHPFFWRTLVKDPSQRDINTLIRLYNTAGPITRFK